MNGGDCMSKKTGSSTKYVVAFESERGRMSLGVRGITPSPENSSQLCECSGGGNFVQVRLVKAS
jgi:hypothetical protein